MCTEIRKIDADSQTDTWEGSIHNKMCFPYVVACDSGNIPFHLTTPSPMPVFLNAHYICESASRLLFLSVHWARSIGAFQLLPSDTQVGLVRGCWSELFALGMAQCSHIMSLPAILTAIITHLQASVAQDKVSAQRVKLVTFC